MTAAERAKALREKYRRARRKKQLERLNECDDRIGRLTSMIATMETERMRLIVEATAIRIALEGKE